VEIDRSLQSLDVGVSRGAVHDDRSGNVFEARACRCVDAEKAAQILKPIELDRDECNGMPRASA